MPTYTDREIFKDRQQGAAATYNMADSNGEVSKIHSFALSFAKSADDAMASTTTAETYTGKSPFQKVRLKALKVVATTGGVTADATNNVTITVYKRDSAGANQLAIATYTSNVAGGSLTQGAPKAMTLTSANVDITADSTITYAITKGGSGVVMRAAEFILELECI